MSTGPHDLMDSITRLPRAHLGFVLRATRTQALSANGPATLLLAVRCWPSMATARAELCRARSPGGVAALSSRTSMSLPSFCSSPLGWSSRLASWRWRSLRRGDVGQRLVALGRLRGRGGDPDEEVGRGRKRREVGRRSGRWG